MDAPWRRHHVRLPEGREFQGRDKEVTRINSHSRQEDTMTFVQQYGPWALVAGASEGTGRAFARKLAADGVPSLLIARRAAPLAALADEIRKESGVACATATIDLSAPDATREIVAAAGDREVG